MGTNFALEAAVAEKLHKELSPALHHLDLTSRVQADTALIVINTLSKMPVRDLANFNNAMVDYITLPRESKEAALSRICVMLTELITS